MTLIGAQVAEAAPTLMTAVRCGPTVDPLVGVQVPQLFEAPTTLRAGVRALARVHPLVSLETRQHREAFPALWAGEGALGAAVDQPVTLQAGGVAEPLPTLWTHKGLLPGVDALVLPQVAQVVKVSAAIAAFIAPLDFNLLLHGTPSPTNSTSRHHPLAAVAAAVCLGRGGGGGGGL